MTDMEDWMTFFKDEDDETKQTIIAEILERKESIMMAKKVLDEITADEHMQEKIASIENFQIDQRTKLYAAIQDGIAQGTSQGITQGIYKEKCEIARALLLESTSIEFIMKITKLELPVIAQIQNELLCEDVTTEKQDN